MPNIKEKLLEIRPDFEDLDFSTVKVCNVYDPMEVKGRIAEAFVLLWLRQMQVDFIDSFSSVCESKRWIKHDNGVTVYDGGNSVREFDFVFSHESGMYVAEVKSMKLNGVQQKIPSSLNLAREQFHTQVSMLLFFPQYTNKIADARNIEERYPQVICVDIGYKKKSLDAAVKRFYTSRFAGRAFSQNL